MDKSIIKLLSTVYGAMVITGLSVTIACAQSDQSIPPPPQSFQSPDAGPNEPGQGVPGGPERGGPPGPGQGPDGSGQWQGSPGAGMNPGPRRNMFGNKGPLGGSSGGYGGPGQGLSPQQREQRRQRMLQMFDKNGDGKLDESEKADMRAYIEKRREQRMLRQSQAGGQNNSQPPQ